MTIVKDYFDYTKQWKSQYGEKTIVLMQVGSFFEVYALKSSIHGQYIGSDIKAFSQINDMEFSIEDQSRHCPIFWNWDFGNGDESITQNPDIFFDSCSTYTVSLEIEDIDGNVDSCSSLVFVSIMGDINQDCNLDVLDIVTTINIVLSGGNYNPTVDFNNDQSVDVLDIVLVVTIIIETYTPSENEFSISDMNNDGMVDVLDIIILVNIVLGD